MLNFLRKIASLSVFFIQNLFAVFLQTSAFALLGLMYAILGKRMMINGQALSWAEVNADDLDTVFGYEREYMEQPTEHGGEETPPSNPQG